ncbi:DUF4365 domain-containing protein [Erythrobacter sp. AP23]|uniref:DUF4365 domain-containing protein n=1 Tax=Erythrobacter sp. AP23 TaxID=499656 RepID=UPI00076C311C|nr:DUF4365 domain-containing protein [Erythrobacter sp. AP23]KWV92596.1 hypothetical protein ASS64_14345 [Erythrobacter sp. AP23]
METPANYQKERLGINAVATAIASLGCIWRETPTGDVGIDAQIEHVNGKGQATGRLVSVQVKSGISYFGNESGEAYRFYPEDKHRIYWEQHPLPVILVLHHPDSQQSYWADVRQQLRGEAPKKALLIPKNQVLQAASAISLFETSGLDESPFIQDLEELCIKMVETRSDNGCFPVSYFDLFTHGLTNIARSIYFGMDVPLMVAETNLRASGADVGVGVGEKEHEFLFAFVKFLLSQNLAHIDFATCLIDWVDRQMQPHFVAPLTSRGRALVQHIHEKEASLVAKGALPNLGATFVAQEAFFAMVPPSFSNRLPRIQEFQAAVRGASNSELTK